MREPDSQQLAAMQIIWDRFHACCTWPTYTEVDRALYRGFDAELSALLSDLYPSMVLFDVHGRPSSQVSLTLAGIVRCRNTAPDIEWALAAVRWCVSVERSHEPEDAESDSLRITADEMRSGLTAAALVVPSADSLNRVFAILSNEGVFSGSAGPNPGTPNEWSFTLDRRVRRFKDVGTLEDLLSATERKPTVPPHLVPAAAPGASLDKVAISAARQVFVIMPFSEEWSDAVYAAIRRGCVEAHAGRRSPGRPRRRAHADRQHHETNRSEHHRRRHRHR